MRGILVALVLILAQIAAHDAFGAGAPQTSRVVLGVDAKSSQRYVQLTDRGPVYPTAEVTCDGNRRTITLTRSSNVGDRTVATYIVPPKISEECSRPPSVGSWFRDGRSRSPGSRSARPGRRIPKP